MSRIIKMLKGYEERVVEVLRGGFCVVRWMFQGCGILHDEKNAILLMFLLWIQA